ncbi:hypothetical protein ILUMI_09962 [Ignelater luminosus]|uniref:BSD domain-containing protein n=1 Tax=Ignelater luminosus TaxID=2038154 RepID=A0A8K0GFF7_IGNLU|nr:hypothetical protein ILUMI_09962 [Ignelater luminosus]
MEGLFYLNKHLISWLGSAAADKQENNEGIENVNQKQDKENNSVDSDITIAPENKSPAEIKSVVNYIYSTIHETSNKIRKVVEESSVFGEFNKEQETFSKNNKRNVAKGFPPWLGCVNEEVLKAECLSLSGDRRNFLRNPPAGLDFHFDYEASFPTALAIMEEDSVLVKMRYNLVPKLIKEVDFWRNYFYRINLICRANELKLIHSHESSSEIELFNRTKNENLESSPETEAQRSADSLMESWEKELESELQVYTVIGQDENYDIQDGDKLEIDTYTEETTTL